MDRVTDTAARPRAWIGDCVESARRSEKHGECLLSSNLFILFSIPLHGLSPSTSIDIGCWPLFSSLNLKAHFFSSITNIHLLIYAMIVTNAIFIIAALFIEQSSASKTLVPGVIHSLHKRAARQTHSLAHDLRVAFQGILVPREVTNNHVVYCKPGKQTTFGGGGGVVNSSSTASTSRSSGSSTSRRTGGSSTKTGSSAAATATVSSPWNLVNTYVRRFFLLETRCTHSCCT